MAAGALVPEGMNVPPNTLVMGTPAKIKRAVTSEEQQRFAGELRQLRRMSAIYKEEQV